MKLKFERFEGLTSFSIRGTVTAADVKILQIGLESLVKDLDSPLIVNMALAKPQDGLAPVLQAIKKNLTVQTKFKIHWISTVKNVGDLPTLNAFTSRLTGFKHRQIGERLILEDHIHELSETLAELKEKVTALIGDESKAHEMILRRRTLKEEERILRETIIAQKERMNHQTKIPTANKEFAEKYKTASEETKKIYGMELDL